MTVEVAVVLVVVATLVITYLGRCWKLVLSDDPGARLQELQDRLKGDIRERVASGRNLDWAHYTDEAARKHEDLREYLRNYGTIALATGVGGTMGALALHLLTGDPSQGDALDRLLREMGWALVASSMGVVGNLGILWGLLPWANRRFNPELDRFLDGLSKEQERQRTQAREPLGQTAAKIIGDRLGQELRTAIGRVPGMFEQLAGTATKLSEAVVEFDAGVTRLTSAANTLSQSTSSLSRMPGDLETVLDKAGKQLSDEAEKLLNAMGAWEAERQRSAEEWHTKLKEVLKQASFQQEEAAGKLNETAQTVAKSVEDLPGRVAAAVERTGESLGRSFREEVLPYVTSLQDIITTGIAAAEAWRVAVTGALDAARKQHDDAIHELLDATNDIVQQGKRLPADVAAAVEKMSQSLGRSFGQEARDHVADLQRSVAESAEKLRRRLEEHASNLLNTTLHDLRDISTKLKDVLENFPRHVDAVTTSLHAGEGKLRDLLSRIEAAASGLGSANEKTEHTLATLRRSAEDHAQAIRELAEVLRKPRGKRRLKNLWRRFSDTARSVIPGERKP